MPFPWDKISNIIPRRVRRSAKNDHMQSNSATSCPESDGSGPHCINSLCLSLSQAVSVPASSSAGSKLCTFGRATSDAAQVVLPLVQAAVGTIPIAGPPIQAAISGLLAALQMIDRKKQNKKALDNLTSRLVRLSNHLSNAPPPRDHLEQSHRNSLAVVLQETSDQLSNLRKFGIGYTSRATQAIVGCSSDINDYLLEYSFAAHMQTQHVVAEIFTQGQIFHSLGTSVLGCVTLIDATGWRHPISMSFCASFEQLKKMLGVLLESDSVEARVQRQYLKEEQYDLCIDHDNQVTQLTSHDWPTIEAGMTIVMRIVLEQSKWRDKRYQCPFCKADNDPSCINDWLIRSIECRRCGRRFQVSDIDRTKKSKNQQGKIDSKQATEAEMHLIRNFHVRWPWILKLFAAAERRERLATELLAELEAERLLLWAETAADHESSDDEHDEFGSNDGEVGYWDADQGENGNSSEDEGKSDAENVRDIAIQYLSLARN